MSKPRQILVCPDEASAAGLDAQICAHLRAVDGNQGSRWSGVQIKDDGTHAIVWDPQLEKIWPDLLLKANHPEQARFSERVEGLPIVSETIDPATKLSNWTEKAAPIAKPDQASEPLTSTDEHLLGGK